MKTKTNSFTPAELEAAGRTCPNGYTARQHAEWLRYRLGPEMWARYVSEMIAARALLAKGD